MNKRNIEKAIETHREIFHQFLTTFAYLDTMISYNISSYFHIDHDKKIELTDLVLCDINSQKQFDIFLRILQKQNIAAEKITNLQKKYTGVRKLRNLLAHSYLIPDENVNFNGKALKLTRLTNSKGKGYSENLQINEFDAQIKHLTELTDELFGMNFPYIKKN